MNNYKIKYTDEMNKSGYTILIPQMLPIQFELIEGVLRGSGYNTVVLPTYDKFAKDHGIKYVNNDMCYPAIIVVGQIISLIEQEKVDPNKLAVLYTQTGGVCRATNYVSIIRKALKDYGCEHIPVIAISFNNIEVHPGFKISYSILNKILQAIVIGDLLMSCSNRCRPYEVIKDSTKKLTNDWIKESIKLINDSNGSKKVYKSIMTKIIDGFENLEIIETRKPRVAVMGEIFVKYNPIANNDIVKIIESLGGEVYLPNLFDFINYANINGSLYYKLFGGSYINHLTSIMIKYYLESYRNVIRKKLENSSRFDSVVKIDEIMDKASRHISLGNKGGEGWLLIGEIIELIESDVKNIMCVQPFACLPSHVTNKGVIRAIKKEFPSVNMSAIDYDFGASEINQLNRIKLFMSNVETHESVTLK
ncbi:2-hydroxyacyl-CoA dehydratase [Mycoplasmatota bacterium WC44]